MFPTSLSQQQLERNGLGTYHGLHFHYRLSIFASAGFYGSVADQPSSIQLTHFRSVCLGWFSCGYFFSAAFQFTTTFNGGEEAPPGAGGGVDQKILAVRGDVVSHGIIACCWHNMRVKQKPRSRRLQTRPSPQPTLSPARPSPSRPRPQRITPRRRRASGLLPTRNRYRRLPFRTRKMTAHRFHVGVRYGHGGGG